jgi:hypothetical protein
MLFQDFPQRDYGKFFGYRSSRYGACTESSRGDGEFPDELPPLILCAIVLSSGTPALLIRAFILSLCSSGGAGLKQDSA